VLPPSPRDGDCPDDQEDHHAERNDRLNGDEQHVDQFDEDRFGQRLGRRRLERAQHETPGVIATRKAAPERYVGRRSGSNAVMPRARGTLINR
jgi:hypothetical protein